MTRSDAAPEPLTDAQQQKRQANAYAESLQWRLDQHRDVVWGHDHVHPDRNDCGGVGGCRLMMTEADAETEIIGRVEAIVREGFRVVVTVEPVTS